MTPESLLSLIQKAPLLSFDFDGTLVQSNDIKLKAFDDLFSEHTAHQKEIQAYTHAHHHTPRWEKFRHVYESILKKTFNKEIESELSRRYEALTTGAVAAAPEVKGAEAFVKSLSGRKLSLLSSTPDAILKEILRRKGWGYFSVAKGAPVVKSDWLGAWAREHGADPQACLFFGDTEEDRLSSEKAGWTFVGVSNPKLKGAGALFVQDFDILRKI